METFVVALVSNADVIEKKIKEKYIFNLK